MKANTAVGLTLLGLFLLLDRRPDAPRNQRKLALISAGLATLIGALTTLEFATRRSFHIDELLVQDYAPTIFTHWPGRMAISTAVSFTLLGCAMLIARRRRGVVLSQAIAILVGGLCTTRLIAYAYGIQNDRGLAFFAAIALHTSATLLILCVGLLCSTAGEGLIAMVTSEQLGGVLARRLLPAAIVVPIALGWLTWQGQVRGYYDAAFGLALCTSADVAVFLFLVWAHSWLLNRLDRDRIELDQGAGERAKEFQQLADSMPQIVFTAQADGWLDYCNQRWIDYTGLSLTQSQSWGGLVAVHPDDAQGVVDRWNQGIANGVTCEFEFRLKRLSDGAYRWHLGRGVPMLDSSGRVVKWYGTSTDIDDYKRSQQALEDSRQQLEARVQERTLELEQSNTLLHAILDSMGDGVLCVNQNYENILVNQAARRLLGDIPRHAPPGQRAEIFGIYHSDKKTLYTTDELPSGRALRGESCDNVEVFLQNPRPGEGRWISCNSRPVQDGSGQLRGAVLVLHDITERKRVEEALIQSEERFRLTVESVSDYAIFMLDCEGKVATWNAGAERIKGYAAEEIIGKHFSCFYPPESVERQDPDAELKTALELGRFQAEGWRIRKDGGRFYAHVSITALHDKTGQPRGFSKITRDITEKKRLKEAQARLLALLEETSDFIGTARSDGTFLYLNRALRRLRGISDDAPIDGMSIEGTCPPRMVELTVKDAIQSAIRFGAWRGENVFQYHSGEEIPVSQLIMSHRNSDGELEFISTIARDISEVKDKEVQLELIQEQLEASLLKERDLARQDPLTGLANRRAFLETSEAEKERSRRYHHCFNIAYIDLDGFKKINDTLGHAVGDQVLRQVGKTLLSNLRSTDTVARLGGDEFAILLVETDAASAERVLRKLHELLRAEMKANRWNVDFSIGLASYLCPPESLDTIIQTADGLMYSVKARGKGNLAVALLA